MLGERQVAAPLMARRAAHRALRLAHRRFQPGEGVGIQLARLRPSRKPQPPSHRQFGHETLVFAFALLAPAASRPGQHCAVQRQSGRQVAPCGHASTLGQRLLQLVRARPDVTEAVPIRVGCSSSGGEGAATTAPPHLCITLAVAGPAWGSLWRTGPVEENTATLPARGVDQRGRDELVKVPEGGAWRGPSAPLMSRPAQDSTGVT